VPRQDGAVVVARCPAGKMVLGGGWSIETPLPPGGADDHMDARPVRIDFQRPAGASSWEVSFTNRVFDQVRVEVYAICATVAP